MSPDASVALVPGGGPAGVRAGETGPGDTGRPRPWGETSEASGSDYIAWCRIARDLHA